MMDEIILRIKNSPDTNSAVTYLNNVADHIVDNMMYNTFAEQFFRAISNILSDSGIDRATTLCRSFFGCFQRQCYVNATFRIPNYSHVVAIVTNYGITPHFYEAVMLSRVVLCSCHTSISLTNLIASSTTATLAPYHYTELYEWSRDVNFEELSKSLYNNTLAQFDIDFAIGNLRTPEIMAECMLRIIHHQDNWSEHINFLTHVTCPRLYNTETGNFSLSENMKHNVVETFSDKRHEVRERVISMGIYNTNIVRRIFNNLMFIYTENTGYWYIDDHGDDVEFDGTLVSNDRCRNVLLPDVAKNGICKVIPTRTFQLNNVMVTAGIAGLCESRKKYLKEFVSTVFDALYTRFDCYSDLVAELMINILVVAESGDINKHIRVYLDDDVRDILTRLAQGMGNKAHDGGDNKVRRLSNDDYDELVNEIIANL